jgi:chromosome segregation ATPase
VDVDAQTDLVAEIVGLNAAIDRAAEAARISLAGRPSASRDDRAWTERDELNRQLQALRERVAAAERRNEGPGSLCAELATLLFFARTLQADAEAWRSALQDRVRELERQRKAACEERERLTAEHDKLVRRREALQSTILQTAARLAQQYRGECRRTVPVITLGDGLTVCSVSVACPRRGFRVPRLWVVTLTGSRDVLIRRE